MQLDEVYNNMEDYGYFIDMETRFCMPEKVEPHPHSDSDLRTDSKPSEQNTSIVFTPACIHLIYVSIIYLLCVYHLVSK